MNFRKTLRRRLRNLHNPKGSVLFLVIAIMSVLMIMASAVYYSVNSAHKQVEVKYKNEQAYQSAVAVSDILSDYLTICNEGGFSDAIIALEEGQELVTKSGDGSNYINLGPGLGDYKITVKKIKGSPADELHILEIITEVDVNGETQTVSTVGEFQTSTTPFSFDRFFTSTGYAPNDVVMSGMTITSEMYLDNEYAQIGSVGNNAGINIKAEVIAAGTLSLNNAPINADGTETFDITAGNNLIMTYEGGQGAMNLNGGRIRVGGNLLQGTSFNYKNDTDVYVVGDFISGRPSDDNNCEIYVNGDAAFFGNEQYNGKVFVNGDVYIDKGVNSGNKFAGGLTLGGNVYLNSASTSLAQQEAFLAKAGIPTSRIKYYNDNNISFVVANGGTQYNDIRKMMDDARDAAGGTAAKAYVWPDADAHSESLTNVVATINKKLGNPQYNNWDMTKKFQNSDGEFYNDPISFNFDGTHKFNSDSTPYQMVVSAENYGQYITMGNLTLPGNGTNWDGYNIVFDTYAGDDGLGNPIYEDMYVYLPANCSYYDKPYTETVDYYSNWQCDGSKTRNDVEEAKCRTEHQAHEDQCGYCGAARPDSAVDYNGQTWNCDCKEYNGQTYWCNGGHNGSGANCNVCGAEAPSWTFVNKPQNVVSCSVCGKRAPDYMMQKLAWQCDGSKYKTGYNPVCYESHNNGESVCPYCGITAESMGIAKTAKQVTHEAGVYSTTGDLNTFRWVNNSAITGEFSGWFSVLTKGEGSVTFVVPANTTYVQQSRVFMGHYNLLKEVLPNAIDGDKAKGWDSLAEVSVSSIINEKKLIKDSVVNKYANQGGIHNNLFMVAIDKNSDVNFDAQYSKFFGFLYAPYMTFSTGVTTEGNVSMLGGLIVSDYEMPQSSRVYIATVPYDYYSRFVPEDATEAERLKYMEKLMAASGGEIGTLGASTTRSWRQYGYNF